MVAVEGPFCDSLMYQVTLAVLDLSHIAAPLLMARILICSTN